MDEDLSDLKFDIPIDTASTSTNSSTTNKKSKQQPPKPKDQFQNAQYQLGATNDPVNSTNQSKDEESGTMKLIPSFLTNASNPGICMLTLLFKSGAIGSYLLLNLFISNLIMVYIIVIVLSAFDFYVVKNITGRILVGLRWQQYIDENGREQWNFQSFDEPAKLDNINKRVFWISTYVAPVVWALLFVWSLLSFSPTNASICIFSYIMTFTNLMAYIKCEKNYKQKMSSFIFDQAKSRLSFGQLAKFGQFASKFTGK
ncbi:UNKNOWN [Stylonychia lemnae]|uniref:Golgi apparatus membrane protein TVP23 homolog n=1 Tax=Stylonychia lemnae TaxID=5949 RepID=A0A078A3X7_STYLE|nr:UNKNOWN [Stylonychia lemnae]|eukprot:CDW76228.1 UNKNOWN [Stylonychia lemnae]